MAKKTDHTSWRRLILGEVDSTIDAARLETERGIHCPTDPGSGSLELLALWGHLARLTDDKAVLEARDQVFDAIQSLTPERLRREAGPALRLPGWMPRARNLRKYHGKPVSEEVEAALNESARICFTTLDDALLANWALTDFGQRPLRRWAERAKAFFVDNVEAFEGASKLAEAIVEDLDEYSAAPAIHAHELVVVSWHAFPERSSR